MHLPTTATVVMVGWVLATGCTSTTGTTPATTAGTDVVTAELADGTWQGTFQVDGQLTNAPAHVGSAGCTAIGRMALDLHQGATSTHRRVSGRLRVWAVTMSGTTGSACGRRDRSRGSLLGTLASDGAHLRADRFHLLGIPYGWLTTNITTFPVTPTMRVQQLQGQFGAGRRHHRLLHGTFTVTRAVARTNSRTGGADLPVRFFGMDSCCDSSLRPVPTRTRSMPRRKTTDPLERGGAPAPVGYGPS